MGMSATTQVTWEQFLEMEETAGKQELLDGELIALPPARVTQMQIAIGFQHLLESVLPASRVWIETGYQLRRGWLQNQARTKPRGVDVQIDVVEGAELNVFVFGARKQISHQANVDADAGRVAIAELVFEIFADRERQHTERRIRRDHDARQSAGGDCLVDIAACGEHAGEGDDGNDTSAESRMGQRSTKAGADPAPHCVLLEPA